MKHLLYLAVHLFICQLAKTKGDYILKHEQVHIKRRDYLIKPVAFIALAIHWFNPIIWLSFVLMVKDMECPVMKV